MVKSKPLMNRDYLPQHSDKDDIVTLSLFLSFFFRLYEITINT